MTDRCVEAVQLHYQVRSVQGSLYISTTLRFDAISLISRWMQRETRIGVRVHSRLIDMIENFERYTWLYFRDVQLLPDALMATGRCICKMPHKMLIIPENV